jgi:hypothetical protein
VACPLACDLAVFRSAVCEGVEERLRSITEEAGRRDPRENAASAPPDDEELRLQAVWLAESYPAAYAEPPLARLGELATGKHGMMARGAEAVSWLEETLRSGGAGWAPLGPIVYAAGTRQNHPNSPGLYRFWLARGWDTRRHRDGPYRLDAEAVDIRGNASRGHRELVLVNNAL